MVRACKIFSVVQFESILQLVADALENGSDGQLHSQMRLSMLLLREAPESKISLP